MSKRLFKPMDSRDTRRFLLTCCVLAILPALVIFLVYSYGDTHSLLITPWTAGDALSYGGTFAAAIIAMLGVYWSLRENRRCLERQTRDETAPYFAVVLLEQVDRRGEWDEMKAAMKRGRVARDVDCGSCKSASSASGEEDYREVEHREIYVTVGSDIANLSLVMSRMIACARNLLKGGPPRVKRRYVRLLSSMSHSDW